MLDYQFLGMVAVVMAVVSRGSLLAVVVVTAAIGLLSLAGEVAGAWWRRRHPIAPAGGTAGPNRRRPVRRRSGRKGAVGTPQPSARDFHRWMSAVERVLHSAD